MDTVRSLLPAIRQGIASDSPNVSSLISQAKLASLDFPSQKSSDPYAPASEEELALNRTLTTPLFCLDFIFPPMCFSLCDLPFPDPLIYTHPFKPCPLPLFVPTKPLALSGELLELSITSLVPKGDWLGFERCLAQLLPLYSAGIVSESGATGESRRLVTGLQLMHLLVEARLADFHCRVETLSEGDIAHPLIAFPLKLEAYLLEGRYNKVRGAPFFSPSEGGTLVCSPRLACALPRASTTHLTPRSHSPHHFPPRFFPSTARPHTPSSGTF